MPIHTPRILHSSKTIESNDTVEIPTHAERRLHYFRPSKLQPVANYSIASLLHLVTQKDLPLLLYILSDSQPKLVKQTLVQHRQNTSWEPATVMSQCTTNSYWIMQKNGTDQPKVYR